MPYIIFAQAIMMVIFYRGNIRFESEATISLLLLMSLLGTLLEVPLQIVRIFQNRFLENRYLQFKYLTYRF
jgi:hypothetical protein